MHVISADTTVADSIRYTQYRFRYDTDPIIVRSLVLVIDLLGSSEENGCKKMFCACLCLKKCMKSVQQFVTEVFIDRVVQLDKVNFGGQVHILHM